MKQIIIIGDPLCQVQQFIENSPLPVVVMSSEDAASKGITSESLLQIKTPELRVTNIIRPFDHNPRKRKTGFTPQSWRRHR